MKKVALIGHPISHSLSSKLHNYWIKQYGIDAEYTAIDVLPEDLESTIKRLQDEGYVGCNITMPYKESMLTADGKPVNVIKFIRKKPSWCNTDEKGFAKSINEVVLGKGWEKLSKILVIGAGGTSKTICSVIGVNMGWCQLTVSARDTIKAENIRNMSKRLYLGYCFYTTEVVDWDMKDEDLSSTDLLINATPCGMAGYPELDIDLSTLNKDAVVFDAIYNPKETGLLKQARELGHKTINGFDMFLYQAQASFEIWFSIKPEITQELRDYIEEGL